MATAPTQDFIVKSGLNVQGTSTVTSSTGNTSTLQVDGGAAIAKNLIVGDNATIYGDLQVYGSIPNLTITTGTFTDLTVSNLSTLNVVTAGVTTASQLTVTTRLAVGGLSELNNATLSNQTNSTSSTTGALQVSGGVGIRKDLWVGGNAYVNGFQVLTTASIDLSTFQTVTEKGSSTTVAISVLNTTSSTSTNSGALTVVGGVGIGGTLNVAGNTSFTSNVSVGGTNNTLTQLTVLGNATTATASLGLFNSGQYGYSGGQIYLGDQTYITGIATWQTAPGIGAIYDNAIHGGSPGGLGLYTDNGSNRTLRMSIDSYGLVKILSTTTQASASSTTTGALQVVGGAGIGENLYVGGTLYVGTSSYINNSLILTTATVGLYAVKTILAGTDTAVNTSTGIVTVWNTSTLQSVTDRGSTTTNAISITNTAAATSTVTGALQVIGGVGIGGNLYVGGEIIADKLTIQLTTVTTTLIQTDDIIRTYNTTSAVSTTTGALQIAGGAGIGENLYVGGALYVGTSSYINNSLILTTATVDLYATKTSILAGTDTAVNTSTGIVTIWNTSTLQSITNRGSTTTNSVSITNTTSAISTQTGALTVVGGVGVGGDLRVGGTIYGTISATGSVSTATNVAGGTAGQLVYQSAPGVTGFVNTASAGQLLVSSGTNSPVYVSTSNIYVGRAATADNASTATTATNLTAGTAGQVPYQTAPGVTSFYGPGTAGQLLVSSGTNAPVYTNTSSIYVGRADVANTATTATNLTAGTAGQVPYQTAPGVTSFYGPGTAGQLLVSSGTNAPIYTNTSSIYVGRADVANTATTATNLTAGTAGQVPYQTAPGVTSFFGPGTAGNILVSNGTSAPSYNNTLTLSGSASATSTTTGALQVVGGVGIGGNLHVGGIIYGAILGTATTATNADNVKTVLQVSSASHYLAFVDSNNSTAAYEALYTTSSFVINPGTGKIGIGNPTPNARLHIGAETEVNITNQSLFVQGSKTGYAGFKGLPLGQLFIYDDTASTAGSGGAISFGANTGASQRTWIASINSERDSATNDATNYGGSLVFYTRPAQATPEERVRITSTGSVGIGTSTPLSKFVVNGGTVNSATYTSSEARIADGTLHLMKTSAGGVFEALRAINNDTTVGTTVRLLAAATSDPFNNANGGKVFIDAVRTASNMDLIFSLNDAGGAAAVERLRILGSGAIAFNGSTSYGVSGQILQSNGNAAPTWISTGSLAAANATTATHLSGGVAGQIPYQTAPGVTSFLSTGTAGDVLVSNGSSAATYNNTLRLAGSTNATSTTSGALQVVGGVGVGGDLFIQGDIRTNDTLFNLINANATTVNFAGDATALTMGASGSGTTNVRNNLTVNGNLTVQGTTTIVDSTVTNIADPIITLGGGTGNSAPTADDNKDRGVAFKWVNNGGTTSTGFFGYDDSTGYLTYVQTATITNEVVSGTKGAMDVNLAGGTAMSIHYQSAADTTAFLAAGSSGYLLQTNGTGSAPTWVSASGVSAGSATNADNIRTILQTASASYYPTFVDSNNASNAYESVYTTSSFSINPSNGNIQIGMTGQDYQPSSGGSHTLRLNAANTSSIGFHDSGSTIGNLKFSGDYGFEIGAYDGVYGPHNTILHGSVGVGTQSPGAKLEVYVSRTASTNAVALLLNDNVTGVQTNGVYKAIRSQSNGGSSVSEIRFVETDGTNNNTAIAFATAPTAGSLTERMRVGPDGNVGIGTQSLGAKLHVSASQDNSILRKEVLRVERVGGAAALAGAGRTSEIAFADASNPTLTASIGGLREAPDGNFNGSLVFYTSITGGAVASAVTSLTERLRITSSGAIAFSGSASYGSSGQVLQSNGNAAPTWINQSSIAAGSAPLTSTYVGYGSGSNLLTGSSSLTWNGTTLYVNGNINAVQGQTASFNASAISILGSPNQGTYAGYLLLAKAYISGFQATSMVEGEFVLKRGGVSSGNRTDRYRVSSCSGYQSEGFVVQVTSGSGVGDHFFVSTVKVTYSGTVYHAIKTTTTGGLPDNGVIFFGSSSNAGMLYVDATYVSSELSFGNYTFLTSAGNLGIGTTSPSGKLHLYQTVGGSNMLTLDTNFASGNAYAINPFITSVSNGGFSIRDVTNSVERLVIQYSTGNVGIGNSSPGYKLEVTTAGGGYATAVALQSDIGGSIAITSNSSGATSRVGLIFRGSDNIGSAISSAREDTGATWKTYMAFYTNNLTGSNVLGLQEKMRITSGGGISFGASGTAYGTSGQVLQSNGDAAPTWVNQSSIAAGSAPLTSTYVGYGSGSNLLTGSSGLTYAGSILNVAYQNTFNTSTPGLGTYGIHLNGQTTADSATGITFSAGQASAANANAGIYTQGSGSYGSKMYFATTDSYGVGSKTRMMIDHAGNVGIGTVAPISRLQVGNQTFSGVHGVYSNARSGLSVNGSLTSIVYASTYNDSTYPDYGMVFVHGPSTSNYNVWSISPDGPAKGSGLGFLYGANTDNIHVSAPKVYFQGSTGNVGIGTAAPASKLTVEGAGTANESVARFNNQGDYASRILLRNSPRSAYFSVAGSTGDTFATGALPYGLLIGLTGSPSPIQFYNGASGAVKMTIDTVGNVGIGTTSTTNKFEVAGSAGQLFSVSDSFTGTIFSANDVSGIPSIEVLDTGLVKLAQYNGAVTIGTGTVASSTASLSVYGMIYTMGTLGEIRASSEITAYFSSDSRLKENIKLIENPITIIDQIRGVTFDWTDEHMARRGGEDGYFVRKHDIGVIAQEVQAVLPELVGTREDGYLAVKYEKLVPLLIEAIKAQQKTIDSLVKDLDTVKEFINNLKNGI